MIKGFLSIVLVSCFSLSAYSGEMGFSSCHQKSPVESYSQGHFGDWDRALRKLNHVRLPIPEKILDFSAKAKIPSIQSDNPEDFFSKLGIYLKSGNLIELHKIETSIACLKSENVDFSQFVLLKPEGFAQFVKPQCSNIRLEITQILQENLPQLRQSLLILLYVHPIAFSSRLWTKSVDDLFPDNIQFPAEVKPFSFFNKLEDLSLKEKQAALELIAQKLSSVSPKKISTARELIEFFTQNQRTPERTKIINLLEELLEEQRLIFSRILNTHPFLAFYSARTPHSTAVHLIESFIEIRKNTLEILREELTLEKLARYPTNLIDQFLKNNNRKFCPAAMAWKAEIKKRQLWGAVKWLSADIGVCTLSAMTGAWPFCLAILATHTGSTIYDSKKKLNETHQRAFSQAFSMDLAQSLQEIKDAKKEFSLQVLLSPLAATGGGKIVSTAATHIIPKTLSAKLRNSLIREKRVDPTTVSNTGQQNLLRRIWSMISSGVATTKKYIFQPLSCFIGACKQAKQVLEKAMMLKPYEELRPWIAYPTTTLGTLFVVYPELQDQYSYVRFKYILDHSEHPLNPFLQGFRYNLHGDNLKLMNQLVHPLYRVLDTPQLSDIKQQLLDKKIAVTDLMDLLSEIDAKYEKLTSVPLFRNTYVQHLKSQMDRNETESQSAHIKNLKNEKNSLLSNSKSSLVKISQLSAINESDNSSTKVGYRFKYVHPSIVRAALPNESIKEITKIGFGLSDQNFNQLSLKDQKLIYNLVKDYLFFNWLFDYYMATELALEIPNTSGRDLQIQLMQSLIQTLRDLHKSYSLQLSMDSKHTLHFLNTIHSIIPADKHTPIEMPRKWTIENSVSSIQVGNMLVEYLFMFTQIQINTILEQQNLEPNYIPYHFSGPKITIKELSEHVIRMNLSDISRTLLITEGPPPNLSETLSSLSEDVKKSLKRQLF